MGLVWTPEALQVVVADMSEPGLVNEAGLAAIAIAEKLTASNPQLACDAAAKVLAQCKGPEIIKRAWAVRGKPTGSGPFIQDWLISGPYSKPGVEGSEAVFNLVFDPEKPDAKVQWKSMPRAEQMNLAAFF